jgi:hypothetical protein
MYCQNGQPFVLIDRLVTVALAASGAVEQL